MADGLDSKFGLLRAYRVLGVDASVSDDALKERHRDLVRVWHPDRFEEDLSMRAKAEGELKAINAAFDTVKAERERLAPRPQPVQTAPPASPTTTSAVSTLVPTPIPPDAPSSGGIAALIVVTLAVLTVVLVSCLASVPNGNNVVVAPTTPGVATAAAQAPAPAPAAPKKPVAKKKPVRLSYITLGSTKSDVRRIQGSPTSITGDNWEYGYSAVCFDSNGKVYRWYTIDRKLKVGFSTKQRAGAHFGIGSTQKAVLAAQGTPTSITGSNFEYGYSAVCFDSNGKVYRWYTIDRKLNTR